MFTKTNIMGFVFNPKLSLAENFRYYPKKLSLQIKSTINKKVKIKDILLILCKNFVNGYLSLQQSFNFIYLFYIHFTKFLV
jgi:hypothetical protein